MIIPVRCFTCGNVLADKWLGFQERIKKYQTEMNVSNEPTIIDIDSKDIKKTPEGRALDDLKLERYCCRRMMLSHVDLIDII